MVAQFNILQVDALEEVREPTAVVDPDADSGSATGGCGFLGCSCSSVHGGFLEELGQEKRSLLKKWEGENYSRRWEFRGVEVEEKDSSRNTKTVGLLNNGKGEIDLWLWANLRIECWE